MCSGFSIIRHCCMQMKISRCRFHRSWCGRRRILKQPQARILPALYLTSFSGRMATATFVGDYAHFLTTRSLGGGIAYIPSNPCASSKQYKTGVSAINNSYNDFPTYSWTVEVVTHELGHNLGSNHTQWCGWVGGPWIIVIQLKADVLQGPLQQMGERS